MQIKLLELYLANFKGIKELTILFAGKDTTITGDNGTGKTTVFDAFTWLLFGKDSNDAKDFNIKTLDKDNNPIHKLEHEVCGKIDVDGRHVNLRRVYREKWVKKRGEQIAEMTGHETLFFVDDVPMSQSEYKARVDFLIKEELAKLITSPVFFNSMDWKLRRKVLEDMAGTLTNDQIFDSIITVTNKGDFNALTSALNQGKTTEAYRKEISVKKGFIKQSLETIPTRIDEAKRSMPEEADFKAIEEAIEKLSIEINKLDEGINDKTKAFDGQYKIILDKREEKDKLEQKLASIKNEAAKAQRQKIQEEEKALSELRNDLSKLDSEIARLRSTINVSKSQISNKDKLITATEEDSAKLRSEWAEENAKTIVIDDNDLNCPTCHQPLPEAVRNEKETLLAANFNTSKQKRLEQINSLGQSNKNLIDKLAGEIAADDKLISKYEADIKKHQQSIGALNEAISQSEQKINGLAAEDIHSPDEKIILEQIASIIIPESPKVDSESLKDEKRQKNSEVDALKTKLAARDQIVKLNARIKELEEEEQSQNQALADLEKIEFSIAAFEKCRIETIEGRINSKFKLVRFKMFESQINGGEAECCECMISGVPFADLNTAGKINAGIDIINALTDYYKINAPVFIDNRESVIRIPPCKSQIINLVAVKDAKLTVSQDEEIITV